MDQIKPLLLFLLLSLVSLPLLSQSSFTPLVPPLVNGEQIKAHEKSLFFKELKKMLHQQTPSMSRGLINTVLTILNCTEKNKTTFNPILTVIDFSLPASQKRLWIFNLNEKKLLLNTYVSHGIKSGIFASHYFSNRHNSKTSSIGVYKTENDYYGRYGLALKLVGLEPGFNSNAFGRAIVMHGGWYVNAAFVEKYGRPGRSWGCPAIPKEHTKFIIDTIKDESLLIAYYPSQNWHMKSKFLNCSNYSPAPQTANLKEKLTKPVENREKIIFIEKNNNNRRDENEPIVVMNAEEYQSLFKRQVPLKRMLRRPLNNMEFVALSPLELNNIIKYYPQLLTSQDSTEKKVLFIIPFIKKIRGYYATEMRIVNPGDIKEITTHKNKKTLNSSSHYTLQFEHKPDATLKTTDQFIRWLGL